MIDNKKNRWRLNKVGLINFWYYDEEEFHFLDGRMLLRGSNGSGKSVTMQSFIPLLLDGNMRPERLDPFGSKARKMDNYLLEEDDDRDERTGYLYMELKRELADQYLTLGIGLRGRKGKKLETWYFVITDGRRIGVDFLLYKDVKSKIPFSKTELRNRIADGGQVLESQREYMELVNRQVFGFETMDEYEELLKLLIQLRTPKLSKDFKPSVINDILTNSLQTLSEDDLRPMSEAIENMDTTKTNIDNLKNSIRAARSIGTVYQRYNQKILYEKAKNYHDSYSKLTRQKNEMEQLNQTYDKGQNEILEKSKECEELKRRQEALGKEIEDLQKHDAFSLAEKESQMSRIQQQLFKDQKQKEKKEAAKKDAETDTQNRKKEAWQNMEQKKGQLQKDVKELVTELATELGEGSFDAAEFFRDEFLEGFEKHFSFKIHEKELEDYHQKVKSGLRALEQQDKEEEKYHNILEGLEQHRQKREEAERKLYQTEELFGEMKEELLERIYRWKKENEILKPSEDALSQVSKVIEQYQFGQDPTRIQECVRAQKNELEEQLRTELALLGSKILTQEEEYEKAQSSLKEWEQKTDPEPERRPETVEYRKRLGELGIQAEPFYQVVKFAENLSDRDSDLLEQMLVEMGILDALVIPAQYREQVLKEGKGISERYIFTDVEQVKENLSKALEVDQKEQDIVAYMNISRVLQGIGSTVESVTGVELLGKGEAATKGRMGSGATEKLTVDIETLEGAKETVEGEKETLDGEASVRNAHEVMVAIDTEKREDNFAASTDSFGRYRIGILEGTVSGAYKACFIGAAARERYRLEQVEYWKEQVLKVNEKLQQTREEIAGLKQKLEMIKTEWENFPSAEGVRSVASDLEKINQQLLGIREAIEQESDRLGKQQKVVDEARQRVQKASQGTYLTVRKDIFARAFDALEDYRRGLGQLKDGYARYEQDQMQYQNYAERLEVLREDLDDIRYDLGKVIQEERKLSIELEAVRNQLALTDYEQIRHQLEECFRLKRELPAQIEHLVKLVERLEGENRQLENKKQLLLEQTKKEEALAELLEEILVKEWKLGYVWKTAELEGEEGNSEGKGIYLEESGVLSEGKGVHLEGKGILSEGKGKSLEESGSERESGDIRSEALSVKMEDQRIKSGEMALHLAKRILRELEAESATIVFDEVNERLQGAFHENKGYLQDYALTHQSIFSELAAELSELTGREQSGYRTTRLDIRAKYKGVMLSFLELLERLALDLEEQEQILSKKDAELFEDILANTISKKIRVKIHQSRRWVKNMNELMESMQTSSGLCLSLKWKSIKAEKEGQLDSNQLVTLLEQDAQIMTDQDSARLSRHFRSKIDEARKKMEEKGNLLSFHAIMRDILDYRQWFEFQLESQKTGEKKKELTDRVFFTFSGGEKAMAMYVPLFSAVVAKFSGARQEAPRIISLDEAFAGVDAMNIKDMFRLMVEFGFDFIINSQILWGDCETVPGLAIYQLLRPKNAKFVSVIPYVWNGRSRELVVEKKEE